MTNDANDAVTLVRAFAAKMGQGYSSISFDPDTGHWTLRFGMKIRGETHGYKWTITAKDLSYIQHPDARGEMIAEDLRRDLHTKAQEAAQPK